MEFDGHVVQVLSLVCPVDAEYLPAPQSVQISDEFAVRLIEYLPAMQLGVCMYPMTVLRW